MRCRECDTPNPPERERCAKCGAKLPPPPGRAPVVSKARPVKPTPRPEDDEDDEDEVEDRRRPARRRPRDDEDYEGEFEDDDDDDDDLDTVARIIPYRNKTALIGYYCAIFSLIPAVVFPFVMFTDRAFPEEFGYLNLILPIAGVVLGGLGLMLGIVGIVSARNHPRAGGGGHAGTALFLGLVTFLACAVCWILYVAQVLPIKLV